MRDWWVEPSGTEYEVALDWQEHGHECRADWQTTNTGHEVCRCDWEQEDETQGSRYSKCTGSKMVGSDIQVTAHTGIFKSCCYINPNNSGVTIMYMT